MASADVNFTNAISKGNHHRLHHKGAYTEKWHHIAIDAPGHRHVVEYVITGVSQADIASPMVPAEVNFTPSIAKGSHKAR